MRGEQPSGPSLDASPFRFAVIVSRFKEAITASLRSSAVDVLSRVGAAGTNVEIFDVPTLTLAYPAFPAITAPTVTIPGA